VWPWVVSPLALGSRLVLVSTGEPDAWPDARRAVRGFPRRGSLPSADRRGPPAGLPDRVHGLLPGAVHDQCPGRTPAAGGARAAGRAGQRPGSSGGPHDHGRVRGGRSHGPLLRRRGSGRTLRRLIRNPTCPALDPGSGACVLYDWRPLSCRTFGPPVRVAREDLPPCECASAGRRGRRSSAAGWRSIPMASSTGCWMSWKRKADPAATRWSPSPLRSPRRPRSLLDGQPTYTAAEAAARRGALKRPRYARTLAARGQASGRPPCPRIWDTGSVHRFPEDARRSSEGGIVGSFCSRARASRLSWRPPGRGGRPPRQGVPWLCGAAAKDHMAAARRSATVGRTST
jgi:hypothetical protein